MVAEYVFTGDCASHRGYGAKVMPAQVILKAMAPLLETKDANARGKVKEIVVSRTQGAEGHNFIYHSEVARLY